LLIGFSIVSVYAAESTEVPLHQIHGTPFYTVDVELDNVGKVEMLVDTGIVETVILDWIVQEKKVPLESKVPDLLKKSPNLPDKARITYVQIGDKQKKINDLLVIPAAPILKQLRIAGMINPLHFFSGQNLFIDFPNKKMIASSNESALSAYSKPAFTTELLECSNEDDGKYMIRGALNENRLAFHLKTGAANSLIRDNYSEIISDPKLAKPKTVPFRLGKVKGELALEASEKNISCTMADAQLGNDYLKGFGIFISADRQQFRLYR
jgi:hypothetical protein